MATTGVNDRGRGSGPGPTTAGRTAGSGEIRRQGTIAAIGEPEVIGGFLLAGVRVHRVTDRAEARTAWRGLPGDVALVVLSPEAARAVSDEPDLGTRLTVVVPP
jgi:hypothetical protein